MFTPIVAQHQGKWVRRQYALAACPRLRADTSGGIIHLFLIVVAAQATAANRGVSR